MSDHQECSQDTDYYLKSTNDKKYLTDEDMNDKDNKVECITFRESSLENNLTNGFGFVEVN